MLKLIKGFLQLSDFVRYCGKEVPIMTNTHAQNTKLEIGQLSCSRLNSQLTPRRQLIIYKIVRIGMKIIKSYNFNY